MKATIWQVLLSIVVLAVVAAGFYLLYWFVLRDATNRRATINRETYEYQQTLRSTVTRKMTDITTIEAQEQTPQVMSQREAVRAEICGLIDQMRGDRPDRVAFFYLQEC